ncbi:cell division cycle-associated protein 2 [Coregonus clupeaformis]|uniref:cell division cycle-associated protein 2 n=1 Tax=Coregonus clupeaformis TaxID=59861 RepID=UPI001BE12BC6|nr:cell division cycle-associated protein 2 [Coregonus clupeaformis]XP_041757266.1 cell division cycle-associated protein 2 [Coregonus clupeaformis]XP_041757267.1 cell division cycle-associated protein 2 [Coregonus clupeaformis]XP_041757268.1 cell division cycle-associated protein 2 [Coregonus clupeaformis]
MASSELKMDSVEGTENLNQLEASCPSPLSITTPLDFSQLTPSQPDISLQSFTPSSNVKEKSRLAQLKAKRRSNVGVRGSPETNSLICYIAQQRMKTPPTTTQPTQTSSFFPRVPSTLKQKMAIFQSIMAVEENENETVPKQNNGGCIKTRDFLSSDGWSCDDGSGGKENKTPVSQPPSLTPPPSKRRYTAGPQGYCVEEIGEANTPVLKCTSTILKQQQNKEVAVVQNKDHHPALTLTPGAQTQSQNDTEFCGEVEHASVSLPPTLHTNAVSQITQDEPQSSPLKQISTPTKEEQDQECSFELHSPSQLLVVHSGPDRTTRPPQFTMPSLLEMNPTDEADSFGGNVNSTVKRKKQVRFGILLPPELFDKNLPPSTPLRKGGTPGRIPTSAGGSQLRSLLKTPQRTPLTLAQPDFSSPSLTGASPSLTMGPCCGEQESTDTQGKITFPSMEEDVDSSLMDNAELETQPLDLNSAFQEEDSVCEALPDAAPVPDPALDCEPEPAAPATARSRSRKRKQPEEESKPVKKRSSRTAAKSACGRMKNSAKRGFGKKAVNRSLYGKRDYASKNPNLSPITENLSSLSCSPNPQHPHTCRHTAKGDSSLLEDVINSDPITGVVMAAALWQSRLCPVDSGDSPEDTTPAAEPSDGPSEDRQALVCSTTGRSGTGRAARAGRRRSGPTNTSRTKEQKEQSFIRGDRGKGRKVSVPVDYCLSEDPEEQVENTDAEQDSTETSQPEVSESSPAKHTVPGDREGEPNAQCTSYPVDTDTDQCTGTLPDAGRSGESPVRADTTPCPPTDEVSTTVAISEQEAVSRVEQRPNKGKHRGEARAPGRSRGRRSSIYARSVIEEAQAPQSNGPEAVEESGQEVENNNHRSEMELGNITEQASSFRDSLLPPWAQEEFSIDDVLRPLPSRGHRSVRRSLRNQSQSSTLEARGSGLAWLPHTSPDSIRAIRRKTRGRRSSIQALLPPPLE